MKEIKAFIKTFKVMDVVHHLREAGFTNLTVSKAEGTGTLKSDETEISTEFAITDSEVAKIEVVCNDSDEENIVSIITEQACTGNRGDGIIYVSDVNKVYKIKDGLKNGE